MQEMNELESVHKLLLLSSFLEFTKRMFLYMNKTPYIVGRHHEIICDALDHVVKCDPKYNKLIINIAPRYGKTLLVSQMFIAYGLAINPMSKFIHLSYSGQLTMDNSVAIKDIINSDYYSCVFDTKIRKGSDTKAKWTTIQGGGVYATSTLGQITGFGAGLVENEEEEKCIDEFAATFSPLKFGGAIVIDDPIRPEDALSENVREKVNRRFETTIRNRVNSRNTPIIIIMQRLHEHDLCGYLNEVEPDGWKVISLPALYNGEDGKEYSLWSFKHTVEELHKLREVNSFVFDTQYMQNPKPIDGLLFSDSDTKWFEGIPDNPEYIHIQVDPSDEGKDRTCSAVYYVINQQVFVVDVIYTSDKSDIVIPRIIEQIGKWGASSCNIESNSAWSLFRKEIKRRAEEAGLKTNIRSISNHINKELRIFNNAPSIVGRFHYRKDSTDKDYQLYLKDRHSYLKMVKNQKDDGVDCDAAACDFFKKNSLIPII